MATKTKYVPGVQKAKAATTAETIQWSESDMLSGSAIKAIHVDMSGSNNDMDALTQIELQAAGKPILRVNELQFNAIVSTLGKRDLAGAAATRFTIDFQMLCGQGGAAPPGVALSLLLTCDNTGGAVNFRVGYTISDDRPTRFPVILANAAGIPASANGNSYLITQAGLLRGIVLPRTTSITSLLLYGPGGELLWNFATQGLMLQAQDYWSGYTTTLNKLLQLPEPVMVEPGMRLEFVCDGSMAVTDQVVLWTDQVWQNEQAAA